MVRILTELGFPPPNKASPVRLISFFPRRVLG
jgi:hypothetical protein